MTAAKTKTTKKPKRVTSKSVDTSQFGSQIQAETDLKFGPQDQSLASQLSDAGTTRDQAIASAGGVRAAIEGASAKAMPQLAANYGSAQRAVDQVSGSLAASLSGAGVLGGAAARDAAGTKERLAEALANAQADTTDRARDAASGQAFAKQNATANYNVAKAKIATQQQGVAEQRGTYAAARAGELGQDEEKNLITQRGQDITSDSAADNRAAADSRAAASGSRADASLDERTPHDKALEKQAAKNARKKGVASPANVEKARTSVNRALDTARSIAAEVTAKEKAAGTKLSPRARVASILVNGRTGQTIKNDPKSGAALANPVKIPGVKAQDQLYASVALDMIYDGRLSRKNQARLAALGLTPKDLGLTAAYSDAHADTQTAPAGGTGRGQARPT